MKRLLGVGFCVCLVWGLAFADTFGTGDNQFTLDFVPISGATNPTSGYGIVENDYRMGTFEITNDQWDKFKNEYGTVTGSPSDAYEWNSRHTGTNVPTDNVSWYEAAQFVNWLNTSNGKSAAYKFSGTQGTSGYTLEVWQAGDAGYDASNPYRNSNAYYFLPTKDEWVKAAYWNSTNLQTYATVGDVAPTQDGWNFYYNGHAAHSGSWDVGSGSEELNGTFDMMGNVSEWTESPYHNGNYLSGASREFRGGSYTLDDYYYLSSSHRLGGTPQIETLNLGFRVASIPEPGSAVLMLAGLGFLRKRRA